MTVFPTYIIPMVDEYCIYKMVDRMGAEFVGVGGDVKASESPKVEKTQL